MTAYSLWTGVKNDKPSIIYLGEVEINDIHE